MRIAFVLNSLQTGGAEIHTAGLAAALLARGHDCLLAPLLPRDEIEAAGALPRANIDGNGLGDLAAMRRLAGILRGFRPDVIVAVNERPLTYAHLARALGGPKAPIVAIYHTTDLLGAKQRFLMRLAKPLFARSEALVYVSGNQRRRWERDGLTAKRVEVIHNGIDAARFSPERAAILRDTQRRSLGYAPTDYIIGMSAAFRPEKNHGQALEALRRLRDRGTMARLLFVGDGPELTSIRTQAVAMGVTESVRFAGRQADVAPFLAAFDVGLLTSTAVETFSLAALETMAMGAPMVMSEIGGASEMIDGVNGCLFPARDTPALVSALESLSDPAVRRAAGTAAAETVRARFTHELMVARYEALFGEVAGA